MADSQDVDEVRRKKRDKRREQFAEKNARRRESKAGMYPEARLLRRSYSGCFGNQHPDVWNQAIQGTTGEQRQAKGRRSENKAA